MRGKTKKKDNKEPWKKIKCSNNTWNPQIITLKYLCQNNGYGRAKRKLFTQKEPWYKIAVSFRQSLSQGLYFYIWEN